MALLLLLLPGFSNGILSTKAQISDSDFIRSTGSIKAKAEALPEPFIYIPVGGGGGTPYIPPSEDTVDPPVDPPLSPEDPR